MIKKKATGLVRLVNATKYSMDGLKSAWQHEAAFRQELFGLAIAVPLGLWLGQTGMEKAVLISSVMVVIVTELLNSALEAVVDRGGLDYHPLAKRAKDLGSAAVFVSILMVLTIWGFIVF